MGKGDRGGLRGGEMRERPLEKIGAQQNREGVTSPFNLVLKNGFKCRTSGYKIAFKIIFLPEKILKIMYRIY